MLTVIYDLKNKCLNSVGKLNLSICTKFDVTLKISLRTVEASGPQDNGWVVQKIVHKGFPSEQSGGTTRQTHLEGQGLPRTGFVVRSDYFRDLHKITLITILRELLLSHSSSPGIHSPRESKFCKMCNNREYTVYLSSIAFII